VRREDPAISATDKLMTLAILHRKCNDGPLRQPLGLRVEFEPNRTTFTRTDVRDNPSFSADIPLRHRMQAVLRYGPKDRDALAREIDATDESVRKAIQRDKGQCFMVLNGGRIGLKTREHEEYPD
jgi:hypothetical protein